MSTVIITNTAIDFQGGICMKNFIFCPDSIDKCTVTAYLQTSGQSEEMKERKIPALVICPGGGYIGVSVREGEPVAKEYFAAGYHVFIVNYSVKENAVNFLPLCQLAATVAHIRKHAEEWSIDGSKIAVCGFSAGGHLAASLGTLFNEDKFQKVWNRVENIRPDALILGYPVILSNEYAQKGSIERVSGSKEGTEEYAWFGLDKHVDEMTPPTFLWHTAADFVVPVENSLSFALALSSAKVPYEMHVLPEGRHGMSVCTKEVGTPDTYNGRWLEWSIRWLNKLFAFEK